jgi:hypothetical protein
MFYYFYQVCVAVFLVQGISIPVLFGATEIIEEFAGTFFFVLPLLTAASAVLVVVYAVKNH